MEESYPNGKKTQWKKEKLLLRSNFSFSQQCFQKDCFPGASKGVIVWEWVNNIRHNLHVRVEQQQGMIALGNNQFLHHKQSMPVKVYTIVRLTLTVITLYQTTKFKTCQKRKHFFLLKVKVCGKDLNPVQIH